MQTRWRLPGKTFVLGEYAVLENPPAPALLLANQFCFSAHIEHQNFRLPEKSPAALYLKRLGISTPLSFERLLPYGGLGASGAEFVSAALLANPSWFKLTAKDRAFTVWEEFQRELNLLGLKQSGADVFLQAYGLERENFCLWIDWENKNVQEIFYPFRFELWHTGIKLPTHEHLGQKLPSFTLLKALVQSAKQASALELPRYLKEARKELQKLGLEAPHSQILVDQALAQPGVLAAKGCGAMGSDIVLLAMEADAPSPVLPATKIAVLPPSRV